MTVFAVTFCVLACVVLCFFVLWLSRELSKTRESLECKSKLLDAASEESDKWFSECLSVDGKLKHADQRAKHWEREYKLAYDNSIETSKHHLALIKTHRERADQLYKRLQLIAQIVPGGADDCIEAIDEIMNLGNGEECPKSNESPSST